MKKTICLLFSLLVILSASGCIELGFENNAVLSVSVEDISSTSATIYYHTKDISELTAVQVTVTPYDEDMDGVVAGYEVDELVQSKSMTFEGGVKVDPSADSSILAVIFNELKPGILYKFNTTATVSGKDYTRKGNFTTLE